MEVSIVVSEGLVEGALLQGIERLLANGFTLSLVQLLGKDSRPLFPVAFNSIVNLFVEKALRFETKTFRLDSSFDYQVVENSSGESNSTAFVVNRGKHLLIASQPKGYNAVQVALLNELRYNDY